MNDHLNCDGAGPHSGDLVKRYPTGEGGAAILCLSCWARENKFNYNRGKETGEPNNWPQYDWNEYKAYGEE